PREGAGSRVRRLRHEAVSVCPAHEQDRRVAASGRRAAAHRAAGSTMNSGGASSPFQRQVIKARHDLRNPLAHILGFSEMLAEHAAKLTLPDLRTDSLALNAVAEQILDAVNQTLDPVKLENGQSSPPRLHEQIRMLAAQILHLTESAAQ